METQLRTLFAVPLGVLFGVMLVAVAQFAAIVSWYVLPAFLAIVGAVYVVNRVMDRAQWATMKALSDRTEAEIEAIERDRSRGMRRPTQVFLAATVLGIVIALIWSPLAVLELLSGA